MTGTEPDIDALGALAALVSEARNPNTLDIDRLPVAELLARINDEDKLVAEAVARELPQIAHAVERIVTAFLAGGRLVYIGAGTSGRLGVLDASECPPTFSVPPDMVIGLIAGGDAALRNAIEGAEDDPDQGAKDLDAIGLTARDVVVGIAASGSTPYVLGALDHASALGAGTVALSCNPGAEIARHAKIAIAPVVGPEVVAGSTRLKSGTAQKLVLNMLSTAAMIRIGKTYGNLMVDLSISNRKLATRAVGLLCEVTGLPVEKAEALLAQSGQDLKTAILSQLAGLDRDEARARLAACGGVLSQALDGANTPPEGR